MGFDLEAPVDSENGNRESKAVTELALKFGFPEAGAATVAPPVSARMSTSGRAASDQRRQVPSRRFEWAAKAAVSLKTEPRLASRS